PGTVETISEHALLLIPQLRLLSTMRKQVADRMEALMDEMTASPSEEANAFRDMALLRSIPGIGRIVTGALFAETAGPLAQRDYYAIRAQGGIAPVTRQSGKTKQVGMRYRCNARLRNALYHWARTACSMTVAANSNTPAFAPPATATGARFAVLPIGS